MVIKCKKNYQVEDLEGMNFLIVIVDIKDVLPLQKINLCRNFNLIGVSVSVTFRHRLNETDTKQISKKTDQIRNQNRHEITEKTRTLIKERDKTRKAISKSSHSEKVILHTKYKRLRNRVNSKKSSGRDEVTQEQLKLGAQVLAIPESKSISIAKKEIKKFCKTLSL